MLEIPMLRKFCSRRISSFRRFCPQLIKLIKYDVTRTCQQVNMSAGKRRNRLNATIFYRFQRKEINSNNNKILEYESSHFAESKARWTLCCQLMNFFLAFHESQKCVLSKTSMLGKFSYARKVCFKRASGLESVFHKGLFRSLPVFTFLSVTGINFMTPLCTRDSYPMLNRI